MRNFIAAIIRAGKRERRLSPRIRSAGTIAVRAGYARKIVLYWESGLVTPPLRAALDYLEAVRT